MMILFKSTSHIHLYQLSSILNQQCSYCENTKQGLTSPCPLLFLWPQEATVYLEHWRYFFSTKDVHSRMNTRSCLHIHCSLLMSNRFPDSTKQHISATTYNHFHLSFFFLHNLYWTLYENKVREHKFSH